MIRFFIIIAFLFEANIAWGEAPPPPAQPAASGQMASLLEYKKSMQIHYESRLAEVISAIVGSSNAEVRVNVDVTATNTEETVSDFDPDKSIITSEKAVGANRDESIQYETKKMVTKKVAPFGSVRNISVALLINEKFFADMNDTQRTEVMSRLEDIIQKTVGFDAVRGDSIAIHPTKLMVYKSDFISPALETTSSYLFYGYVAAGLLIFALGGLIFFLFHRGMPPIKEAVNGEFQGLENNDPSPDLNQKLKYFARHHPDQTVTALRKILRS